MSRSPCTSGLCHYRPPSSQFIRTLLPRLGKPPLEVRLVSDNLSVVSDVVLPLLQRMGPFSLWDVLDLGLSSGSSTAPYSPALSPRGPLLIEFEPVL